LMSRVLHSKTAASRMARASKAVMAARGSTGYLLNSTSAKSEKTQNQKALLL
jgi:hypothetical protein